MAYVGYFINDVWGREGYPVAVGHDHDEVMADTMAMVLGMGITDGSMQVRKKELSEDDIQSFSKILTEFRAKHGLDKFFKTA